MRLLVVVANFIPEIGSAAHIYGDLAAALAKMGNDVEVITSYPREFYLDKKDAGKEFPLEETIAGTRVHRCKTPVSSRDNVVMRGLEHYWLPLAYYKAFKGLHKKFDACLIYVPPLPLYYFARLIKKFDGIPSVLNYQDFHPQELMDVGMLTSRPLIRLMEHMERQSYKNADYITTMSKAGIDFINARVRRRDNITCVYNSVDPVVFNGLKKDFKAEENIRDKLLVSYAGILSPFQGLDDLLDAAKMMTGQKDVIFYIVGDGMVKERLEERVRLESIDNVKIMPLQPRDEYFNIINSSDINVVTLDKRMSAPALPGKFINLLGVRRAVIANVPAENDIARIVQSSGCGIVTEPGKPWQICEAIQKLRADPKYREECGLRGREFLQDEMDLGKSVKVYEHIFSNLAGGAKKKSYHLSSRPTEGGKENHGRIPGLYQRH